MRNLLTNYNLCDIICLQNKSNLHYILGGSNMKIYELIPKNGRKSFYGKAVIVIDNDGAETLYSYNTPIIKRTATGKFVKLWDGWTATTGRHINAFYGMGKAEFMRLPVIG